LRARRRAPYAVGKTLFIDVVAVLTAHGFDPNDIPAKLEGVAFGPDVVVNGAKKHTLFVANDNDFLATVTDTNHPSGIDNPNQFFVFAFEAGDLPTYVPQRLTKHECERDDHRSRDGHDDGFCGFDDDHGRDHDGRFDRCDD
jgi:hypothetical protein